MAIGSSTEPRVQAVSQGCAQMRPHTDGKGLGSRGHAIGLGEAAVGDEGDVALGRGLHGAGALAGRVALLVDGVGVGDGLRVELVDGLALAEALVVLVFDRDGADRHALAAAGAHLGVDVAGVVVDRGLEAAGLALEPGELGVGDDLDVEVPAGLDELGRQRAHRAVVGGEGLVELRHVAAEGRRLLDEVDLVPAFGQVEANTGCRPRLRPARGRRRWTWGEYPTYTLLQQNAQQQDRE